MDNSRKSEDYRRYTLAFLGVAALTFVWFAVNHKCFIWLGFGNDLQDGLTQHYATFVYYGRYIREFFKNLLVHHSFQMPMWDYSIGYGSDIVTTLHYYGIGEPLMALSCLVPARYSEGGYCFFILLRIYMAGLSFLFFCHFHKKTGMSVIFGSLIYCMSGYTLFAGIRHPMFLIPLIFFPLLCLGADKIFRDKNPVFFIAATALAALSNFYFFYMECLFLAGYIFWHCFVTYKGKKLKIILIFAGSAGVAVSIAAVLLLPNVMVLLTSERLQAGHYVPLLYDLSYYTKIFSTFMGGSGRYYANLGYGVVSFLAVALLFVKKERKELKLAFVLLTVFLCIPWVGHFFNGLSYVTNRWIWIYNFLIAFIAADVLPDLYMITKQEKIRLAVFCGGGAVPCMLFQGTRREQTFVLFSVVFLFLAVVLMQEMANITEKQIRLSLVLAFFVSFGINGMYAFGHAESDLLGEYLDAGKGMEELSFAEASQIDNGEFQYRFDQYGVEEPYNAPWPLHQRGVSFHFSLTNPNISQFYRELGINTPYDYSYNNLDGRSALEALASVNQFIVPNGENKYVPYNYRSHQRLQTEEVSVYSASRTLPLGYTYDSWIGRDEYEKLNSVEKQEAMLKGVVLDSEPSGFQRTELSLDTKELNFEWKSDEGSVTEGNSISVRKENSQVRLGFESISDCELYIEIKGIQYDPGDAFFGYTQEELSLLGVYDKNRIRSEQRYKTRESNPFFYIKGNGVKKKVNYLTDKNSFYCGRDSFTVNVGYLDKEASELALIFPKTGVYSFESVKVIAQPVEQINNSIGQRAEHMLENVQMEGNCLSGRISLENSQILCLSMPYSAGWKAYVDGQETDVYRANTMYMALDVSAGEHDIVLRYETPYLKLGAYISLAGIFALVVICRLIKVYKYINT